jgi:hypothetical protein
MRLESSIPPVIESGIGGSIKDKTKYKKIKTNWCGGAYLWFQLEPCGRP